MKDKWDFLNEWRFIYKFNKLIDKNPGHGPNGDCWLWIGGKDKNGYGLFSFKKKIFRACRIAWSIFHKRPIPKDKLTRHKKCAFTSCVNPKHLKIGTHKQNSEDSRRDGTLATGDRSGSRLHPEKLVRGDAHWTRLHPERLLYGDDNPSRRMPERLNPPRGSNHSNAKLNEQKVRKIKKLYKTGKYTHISLGKKFKIYRTVITKILNGQIWKHVK